MVFVLIFGIIRIRIWYYSNNGSIRIRIRPNFETRIVFVFVFGHISKTEYYSYSYSATFLKPNSIRIRIRSQKHYSLTSGTVLFWDGFPNEDQASHVQTMSIVQPYQRFSAFMPG